MIYKKFVNTLFSLFILSSSFSARAADDFANADDDLMRSQIEHVVVMMMENRSFDNMLAWLYSQEKPPLHWIPEYSEHTYHGLSEDSLEQYTNHLKNSLGDLIFSCAPIKGTPSVIDSYFLNSPKYDPNEPFEHVVDQVFGCEGGDQPIMKGFLQDYASLWPERDWLSRKENICAIMETYTEDQLPVLYGLAKHYAVSDMWFSSVPTQTNPNRAFTVCGTSEGQINNGHLGCSQFHADTIFNRLTEESPETSWAIFWQTEMYPEGILATGSKTFTALNKIPDMENHFYKIDQFHEMARKGQLPNYSFIEPQWTLSMNFAPKGISPDSIQDFLLGFQGNDFHPPGDMRLAENLLSNIYTSLSANSASWQKTLLVILFDEHGGLFDHIPPPRAIPPDDDCQNGFKFDRYGVRTPAIFVSPRIKKGTLIRSEDSDVPFDHTSLIATVLKWRQISKENWKMGKRVESAPTFEKVVTLSKPRTDPVVDEVIIQDSSAISDKEDGIHIGDKFCLKNKNGKYFVTGKFPLYHLARLGSEEEKDILEFTGGEGKITHGSFVLIKSNDADLGEANILENILSRLTCFYEPNRHAAGQWWTIKNATFPYLGSEIHYGDQIYLENHVYASLFQYAPSRLASASSIFEDFLVTRAFSEESIGDCFWIIEKPNPVVRAHQEE